MEDEEEEEQEEQTWKPGDLVHCTYCGDEMEASNLNQVGVDPSGVTIWWCGVCTDDWIN